mmetsp:Transcript_14593/g.25641  ORF Transcript_14593/g.25641 Transcript_14593/m.25641 type:complete len:401 (-) Transcript_14593:240-1442(-)
MEDKDDGKDSKKDSVVYLKKLLSVAKRSIEDLKQKLSDRDDLVERQDKLIQDIRKKHANVVELAKKAQGRIGELEERLRNVESDDEEVGEVCVPCGILIRVEQSDGPIWCLTKSRDDNGVVSLEWLDEQEVYSRVSDSELPFQVPALSLSAQDSSRVVENELKLEKEVAELKDKYRRFKVKAEISRKQKDAEIERLSDTNLKLKQNTIVNEDIQDQLEFSKKELDKLSHSQVESLKALQEVNQELVKVKAENRRLVKKQKEEVVKVPASPKRRNSTALLDQYSKLKREYDNYREHVLGVFEEKDAQVAALENRLNGSVEQPKKPQEKGRLSREHEKQQAVVERAYIKNILLKYMGAADVEKQVIEAALATALEFTPEEIQDVQKRRDANKSPAKEGWFGF